MDIYLKKEDAKEGLYTEALQNAIDEVFASGGGRVILPQGTFMTGTLWLKSHVELHLEQGAVLLGSPNLEDYNADDAYEQNYSCYAEGWVGKHLIIVHEATDVAITGLGTIDGNGQAFMAEKGQGFGLIYPWREGRAGEKVPGVCRPGQLICFIECRNVTLRDVSIRNATSWTVFLYGCDYVSVSGLRIVKASEGEVMPASKWGKLKTIVQIVAIIWLLLEMGIPFFAQFNLGIWILYLAVILTLVSGAEYFKDFDIKS